MLGLEGELLAYATATPPPWVKTAGAAEAWALLLTLRENPFPPYVLTDCMGLLHAAKAGPAASTRAKKTDARIWKEISDVTGGCFKELLNCLTWMPAHTTAAQAETRAKSNGRQLTTAEWRANQLADCLAKRGATCSPLRDDADRVIKAAGHALLLSAARLGVITRAANNHQIEGTKPNGDKCVITKRDSSALPPSLAKTKHIKAELRAAEVEKVTQPLPSPPAAAAPLVEPSRALVQGRLKRQRGTARLDLEASRLASILAASAAAAQPQAVSAADRLAAIRRRLSLNGV